MDRNAFSTGNINLLRPMLRRHSAKSGVARGIGMASGTSPRQVSLIHVFLSSPGDVADERIEASQVLEELPKELLPGGCIIFEAESWNDFGCRFPAVVGASGIGKPPLVDAGPDDALGRAGQIR